MLTVQGPGEDITKAFGEDKHGGQETGAERIQRQAERCPIPFGPLDGAVKLGIRVGHVCMPIHGQHPIGVHQPIGSCEPAAAGAHMALPVSTLQR